MTKRMAMMMKWVDCRAWGSLACGRTWFMGMVAISASSPMAT